ncbi:formate dehydrogenase beta subunit [Actinoplanes sp. NPDC049265]|uniref:formate dehydrogenase beta subunit n=1 Tax=Actinoplanes sp. NPDC049265 TaxID=3363902 RepID=UPI003710CF33
MTTVHVPRDSAARSVGADEVAAAIQAHYPSLTVVRNGSRGLLWLEPLVEVDTPAGRVGFGPVTPADVPGLPLLALSTNAHHSPGVGPVAEPEPLLALSTNAHHSPGVGPVAEPEPLLALSTNTHHPLGIGLVEEHEWLAGQQRVTFARMGVTDPLSLDDYVAHGGLAGLRRARAMTPAQVVAEVTESGLRGRGGAGFPAGVKWKTVLECPGDLKFVCCNADEGDSGTYADRMVLEGDPFMLIEGMAIAAHAVGASEGYIYIRSEYPDGVAVMREAIGRAAAWLDGFRLEVRVGAGAYICGEETSMLESLEGKRGMVRAKPPIPAFEGLFGRPTVINNVLTLATVPTILAGGAEAYRELGVERSRGTQVFQLGGNVARGGIVETAFGITLGELVEGYGGGTRSGRPVRAVQVGGPLGAYVPTDDFDLPMDYEAFAKAGAMLGHGGIVVFDDSVDMAAQARFAFEFCAAESCGKCTPCRVGAVRGVEVIDRIRSGVDRDENLAVLEDLCELMTDGSLCAMGGLTPMPVRSALTHFPDDFEARQP